MSSRLDLFSPPSRISLHFLLCAQTMKRCVFSFNCSLHHLSVLICFQCFNHSFYIHYYPELTIWYSFEPGALTLLFLCTIKSMHAVLCDINTKYSNSLAACTCPVFDRTDLFLKIYCKESMYNIFFSQSYLASWYCQSSIQCSRHTPARTW